MTDNKTKLIVAPINQTPKNCNGARMEPNTLTTTFGNPIAGNQTSLTAGAAIAAGLQRG
jgi:hypothetical protein